MQVVGLQGALLALGFDVEVIDFHPKKIDVESLSGLDRKLHILFSEFRAKHLNLTPTTYYDASKLDALDADILIVGSDQVWNTSLSIVHENIEAYFLGFGSKTLKRIAYAASNGGALVNSMQKKKVQEMLDGFSAISIREKEVAYMLEPLDRTAPIVVPDPSLLWHDYPINKPMINLPEKFIVLYALQPTFFVRDVIYKAKKKFNLPVINISLQRHEGVDINAIDIDPSQWLYLIDNADFVITNSFHGMVFSIKRKKQFLVIPLEGRGRLNRRKKKLTKFFDNVCLGRVNKLLDFKYDYNNSKNNRFYSHLDVLHLESRAVKTRDDALRCFDEKIDYSKVESAMSVFIKTGLGFLKKSL